MKVQVNFYTPRREAQFDCRICKRDISTRDVIMRDPISYQIITDLDELDWYDGDGNVCSTEGCLRRIQLTPNSWTYDYIEIKHDHKPARFDGPTLEFDDDVQVTYATLKSDGKTIAIYDDSDWVLVMTQEESKKFLALSSNPYYEGEHHSDFSVSISPS